MNAFLGYLMLQIWLIKLLKLFLEISDVKFKKLKITITFNYIE